MIKKNKASGFSLIEILIVLGLMAVIIITVAVPRQSQQKAYTNYFRRFSLMSKKIKNRAQIENATYRMVFLLTNDEEPVITVEKAEGAALLGTEDETEELFENIYKKKLEEQKQTEEEKKESQKVSNFKLSKRFDPEQLDKPKGLQIKQIEISGLPTIIEPESLGAFHYFPNGLVEEVAIQVQTEDESLQWTLVSDPLTGEFYTFGSFKTLKEIKSL